MKGKRRKWHLSLAICGNRHPRHAIVSPPSPPQPRCALLWKSNFSIAWYAKEWNARSHFGPNAANKSNSNISQNRWTARKALAVWVNMRISAAAHWCPLHGAGDTPKSVITNYVANGDLNDFWSTICATAFERCIVSPALDFALHINLRSLWLLPQSSNTDQSTNESKLFCELPSMCDCVHTTFRNWNVFIQLKTNDFRCRECKGIVLSALFGALFSAVRNKLCVHLNYCLHTARVLCQILNFQRPPPFNHSSMPNSISNSIQ